MSKDRRFGNWILDLLPEQEVEGVASSFERVTIPLSETVYQLGEPIREVHFPVTCVLSSVIVLQDGATVEAETIGREGSTGPRFLLEEFTSPYLVTQQVEGESLRLSARAFRRWLDESQTLRSLLARYASVLLRQAAQNGACNVRHSVEERMCRWLLECSTRVGSNQIRITQEFLGAMLGVRRQSVNLTAGQLQKAGLIEYRRANAKILDRERLEQSACECYRTNQEAYEQRMRLPAK